MYEPFDLTGKVAVITGGNGGIGLGFAEAVAQAGAAVCIWGTNADKNAAALDKLRGHGGAAEAMVCDVTDSAAVDEAMAATVERFGRVDACFANAGVTGRTKSMFEIDDDEWRRVIGVNLDGAFYTLRAAAKHMVARAEAGDPGGRLVGTASLAALSGAARNEHYAATKGALVSMLRAMAVEFARWGVTANAVLPGWIETEMTSPSFNWDKFRDAVLPRIPARRWGTPEDFGGIAVYLTSDASAYHTADSLLIDGGYWVF
jgi:NAD(P)-dependent dehydrogenase (short-subunit alcohol dehydrogenase family)